MKRDKYKTKADVVAAVKKSFADGAAALKTKGDKGMTELIVEPFGNQQVRVYDFAYGFIEHGGEHYGQLVATTAWQAWCRQNRARRNNPN